MLRTSLHPPHGRTGRWLIRTGYLAQLPQRRIGVLAPPASLEGDRFVPTGVVRHHVRGSSLSKRRDRRGRLAGKQPRHSEIERDFRHVRLASRQRRQPIGGLAESSLSIWCEALAEGVEQLVALFVRSANGQREVCG